jgi:hypothetical protein
MALSIHGGQPTALASGHYLSIAIAADTTSVYWAESVGPVMKVPIGGGPPTVLAKSEQDGIATAITLDSANVYWTTHWGTGPDGIVNGAVLKVPLDGGIPTTLASGPYRPDTLAVNAGNVYWTTWGTDTPAVMKVAIDGGAPTVVASAGSGCFAVDATNLYSCSLEGDIMKAPIAGGAPTTLASAQNLLGNIAIDATSVYWIDSDLYTSKVMKVPMDGGTPTILASMDGHPSKVAVDDTSVYWVTRNTGSPDRLMKLTPK